MNKLDKRLLLFFIAVFLSSLACSVLDDLNQKANQAKSTLNQASTQVQEGQDWIHTAQALATNAGESGFLETAEAVATEIGESGFLETAQAVVTEVGESGFVQTAQVYATQQAPILQETIRAITSKVPSNSGDVPQDIPIINDEIENLLTSENFVSYVTPQAYREVIEFYMTSAPEYGWSTLDTNTVETDQVTILYYEKADQVMTITISIIPGSNKTLVLVNINSQ